MKEPLKRSTRIGSIGRIMRETWTSRRVQLKVERALRGMSGLWYMSVKRETVVSFDRGRGPIRRSQMRLVVLLCTTAYM